MTILDYVDRTLKRQNQLTILMLKVRYLHMLSSQTQAVEGLSSHPEYNTMDSDTLSDNTYQS